MSDTPMDLFSDNADSFEENTPSLDNLFGNLNKEEDAGAAVPHNPFKFLDAYGPDDLDIFFGRDEETKELLRRLYQSPTLLVYGASGSGKSSILDCGLPGIVPSSDACFTRIRCGATPLEGLTRDLQKKCLELGIIENEKSPETSPAGLAAKLGSSLHKQVVLVFDQFEEIYIMTGKEERLAFYKQLKILLHMGKDVRFIFSIREEYLARLTELETVIPGLFDNRLRIEKMHVNRTVEIIRLSCEKGLINIPPELAAAISNGLSLQGETELSYLQVYMDKLCRFALKESPQKPVINETLLKKAGSFDDVLAAFLEEQLLATPQPEHYRTLLKTTITPEGTKRQLSIKEMAAAFAGLEGALSENEIAAMAARFVNARILRETENGSSYELRHDSLAAKVAEWLTAQEKEFLEVEASLRLRVRDYQNRKVFLDASFLSVLEPYQRRLSRNPEYKALIEESHRLLTRQRKRLRFFIGGAVAAMLLVIVVVVGISYRNVMVEKDRADNTLVSIYNREGDTACRERRYCGAAIYAAKSLEIKDTVAGRMIGMEALHFLSPLISTIQGHSDDVYSVAYSPDGSTLASGSGDMTIKLWNAKTGELLRTFMGHSDAVTSVAFSPDGSTLASGSWDDTIKLWNVKTGELLRTFTGPSDGVTSVAFSPDGSTLASGSCDNIIKLWNVKTGELLRTFTGHSSSVRSVAFSPDGSTIASGSWDDTIKLWNVKTGELLRSFTGPSDGVTSVALSPDGSTLASGSQDETIKLWNAKTGELLRTFTGHSGFILSVAFSPDGSTLASGSDDMTIKLWNAKTGELLRTFTGHSDAVTSVAFSPDGSTLASGSSDDTIKLWNVKTGTLLRTFTGQSSSVLSVAFSPDGSTIASGSSDETIKLWNVKTGEIVRTFTGHSSDVNSVAFSPDGSTLASESRDETIKLWNVKTGTLLRTFTGHSDYIDSVAFSPDGSTLAFGSSDNTIKLWNAKTGQLLRTFTGHSSSVFSVAISPDGSTLASGSWDNTIKLWPTADFMSYDDILTRVEGYVNYVLPYTMDVNGALIPKDPVEFAEAKLAAGKKGKIAIFPNGGRDYVEYFKNELAQAKEMVEKGARRQE